MLARVQDEPIDFQSLMTLQSPGKTGAMVTFTGVVRELDRGSKIQALQYEAYKEMAESELGRIAGDAINEFGLFDARIVHRTGTLKPGEPSLFVAVESEHRERGFSACVKIVELIKEKAPIWKKDIITGEPSRWHD